MEEAVKLNDTWNHPNPVERKLWRGGILKELKSMSLQNVWNIIEID